MLNQQLEVTITDGSPFGLGVTDDSTGIPATLAVWMTGALVLTGLIFWLGCRFPSSGALSWADLGIYAMTYICAAVAIYATVLQGIYRLFGDRIELPYRDLIKQTWAAAGWVPSLALLEHQHSPLVAVVPLVIAAQITLFLRNLTRREAQSDPEPTEERPLFSGPTPGSTSRIRPALITSIALQFGIGLLMFSQHLLAGVWFAGAIVYPIWKLPGNALAPSQQVTRARNPFRSLKKILLLLTATSLALLPFLDDPSIAGPFIRLLKFDANELRPSVIPPQHRGNFFSGLILLPHTKSTKQLLTLPSGSPQPAFSIALRKPLEIEFDGVYWYFEPMYEHPGADAPTVHGNPVKNTVHSTYDEPVAMVANQTLSQPIPVACCRALRVQIVNAEGSLGPIHLEIILKDTAARKGPRTLLLGATLIPSSSEPNDQIALHPVAETLTFPFPRTVRLREFNEISVAVKPFNERVKRGAHISIKKFTLVP